MSRVRALCARCAGFGICATVEVLFFPQMRAVSEPFQKMVESAFASRDGDAGEAGFLRPPYMRLLPPHRLAAVGLSTRCLLGMLASSRADSSRIRSMHSVSGDVTLITFDVDGTLVKGAAGQSAESSAHARAFSHGLSEVLAAGAKTVPLPAEVLPTAKFHGSTDGLIALRLADAVLGIPPSEATDNLPQIFRSMYEYCAALSDEEMTFGIDPLPGVLETLASLAGRSDVVCGLVTGNVEGIARKKMRSVGVLATGALAPAADEQTWRGEEESSFLGGFGSDFCSGDIDDMSRNHLDRAEQIVIAARRCRLLCACSLPTCFLSLLPRDRCRSLLGPGARLARVVHVGDAPADVLAARHCADDSRLGPGTVVGCVGVATGSYSAELLTELCGPARPGAWEPVVLEEGLADARFVEACGVPP